MYVQPLNIKPLKVDYGHLAVGELLPVELLCRLALTKKFMARIEDRKVSRKAVERLMVFSEFRDGARLRPGFVECSTKFEPSDRYLSDTEASQIINCHKRWLTDTCYKSVEEVFEHLYVFFKFSNFVLMDGKLEGGINHNGDFIIGDSISPDELRLIGLDGRSYDKDPVREWYEKTYPSWKQALDAAKQEFPDKKNKWPPYPGVPPVSVINDMIARYQSVAEEINAI
jgi:phosphoribosylaminoimidazole-succinocarboxamide synthase